MVKKYEDKLTLNEKTSVGELSYKDVKKWYDFMVDFYHDLDAVHRYCPFIAKTFEDAEKEATALTDASCLMMQSVCRLIITLRNEVSSRNNTTIE